MFSKKELFNILNYFNKISEISQLLKIYSIKNVIFYYYFLLISPISYSQNNSDTSFVSALKYMKGTYTTVINDESNLINGREDVNYNYKLIGHPYFEDRDWKAGKVHFDGSLYENVLLSYNLLTQQLIVKHFESYYRIELIKDKVADFSIPGHHFINLKNISSKVDGLDPGYYDLLSDGKIKVLARYRKEIHESVNSDRVERTVVSTTHYFVLKNSIYHRINNKASLLSLFNERKKEIKNNTDNPPHYKARDQYVNKVNEKNFLNTANEFKIGQTPQPMIFEITPQPSVLLH